MFLELEIVLADKLFAEALSLAQQIMQDHPEDAGVINESLYLSAKAYYGLDDTEQAISILRGLMAHDSGYRDISVLIADWESELF